jgi:hypothetical protein
MPEIWQVLSDSQRNKLLNDVLFLLSATVNYKDIKINRLLIRLAELSVSEQNLTSRSIIYAILNSIDYKTIPQEAKKNASAAMIRNKEYSSGLAISLLADQTEKDFIADFKANYEKYEMSVMAELGLPLKILSDYSSEKWLKLVERVKNLNLLSWEGSSHPAGNRNFGIELEMAPLSPKFRGEEFNLKLAEMQIIDALKSDMADDADGVNNDGTMAKNTSIIKSNKIEIQGNPKRGLWLEIKSGYGGFALNQENLSILQAELRKIEHSMPSQFLSFHGHIDLAASSTKQIKHIFLDCTSPARHGPTHEIRSFTPPFLHCGNLKQGNIIDVVGLEKIGYFCCRLDELKIDGGLDEKNLEINIDGHETNNSGWRKIMALSICGWSPKQRAAAIYTANSGKNFLETNLSVSIIKDKVIKNQQAECCRQLLNDSFEPRLQGIINAIINKFGLKFLISLYQENNSANVNACLIIKVSKQDIPMAAKFLVSDFCFNDIFSRQADDPVFVNMAKNSIFIRALEVLGKQGLNFVVRHYDKLSDIATKRYLYDKLMIKGSADQKKFFIKFYAVETDKNAKFLLIKFASRCNAAVAFDLLQKFYELDKRIFIRIRIIDAFENISCSGIDRILDQWRQNAHNPNLINALVHCLFTKNLVAIKRFENYFAIAKKWMQEEQNASGEKIMSDLVLQIADRRKNDLTQADCKDFCKFYEKAESQSYKNILVILISYCPGGAQAIDKFYGREKLGSTRDALLLSAITHGGEEGLQLGMKRYSEIKDDRIKTGILSLVVRNLDEARFNFVLDNYNKQNEDGRAKIIDIGSKRCDRRYVNKFLRKMYEIESSVKLKKEILRLLVCHAFDKSDIEFVIEHCQMPLLDKEFFSDLVVQAVRFLSQDGFWLGWSYYDQLDSLAKIQVVKYLINEYDKKDKFKMLKDSMQKFGKDFEASFVCALGHNPDFGLLKNIYKHVGAYFNDEEFIFGDFILKKLLQNHEKKGLDFVFSHCLDIKRDLLLSELCDAIKKQNPEKYIKQLKRKRKQGNYEKVDKMIEYISTDRDR